MFSVNYSFTTGREHLPMTCAFNPRASRAVNIAICVIPDCVLYAVGKPVYFKSTEQNYGAWLRDPLARNDVVAERIWMTKENDGFQLFEYANKAAYRNNIPSKVYRMQFPFKVNGNRFSDDVSFFSSRVVLQGNAHVVYNGYFYYYRRDEPKIVKYDLTFDKQAGEA